MSTIEEVQKLAMLSRIRIKDLELKKFTDEFDAILKYVGQLESLRIPDSALRIPELRNVMREDGEPHEAGKYTEALVAQFSAQNGNALSVKQVIRHEKT